MASIVFASDWLLATSGRHVDHPFSAVFAMMQEGVGQIPENLTPELVDNLYERGMEYLQTRVSYIFANNRLHHNDWVVATWAKYLSRSVILQKGSDADRSNLPANAHTAVAQIMQQKTVGLALKTKGRPNPVRKMSVLLTRMS